MTCVSKESEIKTKIVEEPMTVAKSYVFFFFWRGGGALRFGGRGNKYLVGESLLGRFL